MPSSPRAWPTVAPGGSSLMALWLFFYMSCGCLTTMLIRLWGDWCPAHPNGRVHWPSSAHWTTQSLLARHFIHILSLFSVIHHPWTSLALRGTLFNNTKKLKSHRTVTDTFPPREGWIPCTSVGKPVQVQKKVIWGFHPKLEQNTQALIYF